MQRTKKNHRVHLGITLRALIAKHVRVSGRSYRHLARAVEMEPNYISSYLSVDAEKWALPKPPTFDLILSEIGINEEGLELEAAKALSSNPNEGATGPSAGAAK